MRQEVTDAVGECLSQPRQELGLLLDSLDLARDNLKKFDEIDLNQWEELLDRVKMLAKFIVTLSNFDDGLELLVTGKQLKDLTSFEDNARHSIGLVPISYPQLQRINHREVNEQLNPTAQHRFDPIDNRQAQEDRPLLIPVEWDERRNNQRPVTQLRRPAAAEIPFERRSFYPLRWRVSV
ncbi:unnamed protein product [Adineta steineri]|uniref:Uncharacterized protein n=1 Tax=Adineta steineri TaxID=433720 RepID=A0A815N136_9BILA|nr:unnamed protein product [Adineta steineri]CAF1456248.1 unnamed protein product [Adineta steineri]CAF3973162.1 unnamed protein product [Adineta steineri]CAF3984268.1 unnamed protein product [Adineta steineri]